MVMLMVEVLEAIIAFALADADIRAGRFLSP